MRSVSVEREIDEIGPAERDPAEALRQDIDPLDLEQSAARWPVSFEDRGW